MTVASAERLGRYTLVKQLGAGGMGELFLARADGIAGFAKLVALKRILAHRASNERHVRMLLHEARLVASLQHPNIAQVYDVGVDGGQYFFAMEYVHGQDLRHVLHRAVRRQLALENCLHVAIGVSAGLHHAHEARDPSGESLGIVHRDVSPGNVLVSYDGAVKLVDFGVAKASTAVSETREGTVKGKYGYMSPEQCLGAPLDRRSDIFAVGILLWEMTVGRRLFKIQGELATLQRVVYVDAPRPSRYVTDFPPQLEAIIMRALARDPEQRYATAEQLQIDLQDFAVHQRLAVSSVTMAREMNELFKDRVDAWREAERLGRSLADHLAELETPDESLDSDELDGVIGDLHTNVFTPDPVLATPGDLPPSLAAAAGVHRVLPSAEGAVVAPAPVVHGPGEDARPRRRWIAATLVLVLVLGLAAAAYVVFLQPGLPGTEAAREKQPAIAMQTMPAVAPTPPAVEPMPAVEATPPAVEPAPAGQPPTVAAAEPDALSPDAVTDIAPHEPVAEHDDGDVEPARDHDNHSRAHRSKAKGAGKPKSKHEPAAESTEHVETTSKPVTETAVPPKQAAANAGSGATTATAAVTKPTAPPPGTVDANAVRTVVRGHIGEIQACVSRARMDDRDLSGRVTMRIELSPTGAVTATSISSSTGATPSLEACMRKAVAGWTFPAPSGRVAASIRYPFAF